MKIAVQGKIIDTEDIYKIGDIKESFLTPDTGLFYVFYIWFFDNKRMPVTIDCFDGYDDRLKKKLERLRHKIINVWENNPPKIPQFNI